MTSSPPLSVIIPWCDRPELGTTLQANAREFSALGCEVLVINCGGDSTALVELLEGLEPPAASFDLIAYEVVAETFNKSLALNHGAAAANSQRLFFLDTDIVLGDTFLDQATEATEASTEGSFVTVDRVEESQSGRGLGDSKLLEIVHSMEFETVDGRRARVETNRLRFSDGSRSAPGLVMLQRSDFLAVGGMSSRLGGWGWEDLDLLVRLQLQLNLIWQRVGTVIHLSHGDEARSFQQGSKAADQQQNLGSCLEQYHQGCFLGTYKEDTNDLSTTLRRLI